MPLTRATSVRAEKVGFWIFASYRVHAGRGQTYVVPRRTFERAVRSGAAVCIANEGGRALWMVGEWFYWDADGLAADDIELLVWDRERRGDAKLERLRKLRIRADDIEERRRERIPDEVRIFVWERDGGRCVRCGAQEDLQFDHIIPVAKGGASSIENVKCCAVTATGRRATRSREAGVA